ncbi:MAG: T9SS type A sorting domain-containing protein [Ignavibacteria bacterium]|nr:T9SS type A sorting domain-containing protein [Ignavibacteria bacterium]
MRKLNIVLMLLSLLAVNSFAQPVWQAQNPLPFSADYKCSFFVNSSTGWIAGSSGIILKTTNEGANWVKQNFNKAYDINSIYFTNSLTGFFVSDYGILKTTNGGNNFSFSNEANGNTVYFTNSATGFAAGDAGIIYKTTDGGNFWKYQSSLLFDITYLKFANANTGIMFAGNLFHRTTSGGNNWSFEILPNSSSAMGVYFLNESTGWVSSYYYFYRTTNGGTNWETFYLPIEQRFNTMYFTDLQNGYACADSGRVYITANSGVSWTQLTGGLNSKASFNTLAKTNTNTIITAGSKGYIYKTTNNGTNFLGFGNFFSDKNLSDVKFFNSSTGFTAGAESTFLVTTNGGANWISRSPPGTTYSYFIFNENISYAVYSNSSYYYKTTNAGVNWSLNNFGTGSADKITFFNQNTGVAVGIGNTLTTTNGGTSWTNYTASGITTQIVSVSFGNQNTGWFAGNNPNRIYKTTNGGVNWNSISADVVNYASIFFINDLTGWTLCSSPYKMVRKSTDGGIAWQIYILPDTSLTPKKIKFVNPSTGFILASNGTILLTTNGGMNWATQSPETGYSFNDISFADNNTGWAAGDNGIIFKTTNGGLTFIQNGTIAPDKFSLSQNYPNPFNPSTVIRYQLSVAGFTTLKVFDLLGKEVASLVNEKQSAGSYSVDFNSSEYNLPSGIYFYTLTAGDFKETRKMVLIK